MTARRPGSVLRATALSLALLLPACGTSTTDEPSAGGEVQGGSAGAGSTDAGSTDADSADGGSADGSTEGGSTDDGSVEDGGWDERPLQPPEDFTRIPGIVDLASVDPPGDGLSAWQAVVPGVQDVRIPSTADGGQQPALWLPPDGEDAQPLLVVLHSWSTTYVQDSSTPYGRWADQEGWAMVAPNFRGAYEKPEATASDLAVQDVVDAVDWAVDQGGVDEDRVFVVGFSGGGLMSLVMAGRHPERFAGAVSFVPMYDLTAWYAYNTGAQGSRPARYARQIAASCGGDPTTEADARAQCDYRSPLSHLDGAREADLPVYVAHGLRDQTVPPDHGVKAFNQLAEPEDRLGQDVLMAVTRNTLPPEVPGETAQSFFAPQDPEVHLARRSGPVTLVLFEGQHDVVFHPGLAWMAALADRLED